MNRRAPDQIGSTTYSTSGPDWGKLGTRRVDASIIVEIASLRNGSDRVYAKVTIEVFSPFFIKKSEPELLRSVLATAMRHPGLDVRP